MYVLVDCEWEKIKETPTGESGHNAYKQRVSTCVLCIAFRWNIFGVFFM